MKLTKSAQNSSLKIKDDFYKADSFLTSSVNRVYHVYHDDEAF